MEVRYVQDEGGLASKEGFVEFQESVETRFVRVPGAMITLLIEEPKILKVVSYKALKDARRTDATPSFPGQQEANDLASSTETIIRGKASVSGLGASRRTTISTLGEPPDHTEIEVRLQNARLDKSEEVTGFSINWFPEEYVEPHGGFILSGYLLHKDIDLLVEELRATNGSLVLELHIGLFPGFFGEWSFDGWDGGKLKFANHEICSRVVANQEKIPKDFFRPEAPFDTRAYTRGPHDLVSLMVTSNGKTSQV